MTQHLKDRLHVFLLSVGVALGLSGCWWLQRPAPESPLLRNWGVHRLAVVDFGDATHQSVGSRVTEGFRRELASALGKDTVLLSKLEVPQGPRPVGLIGISQAQQIGRLNDVDALVSGQVLAYQWQRSVGRVWVSVSLRLLDTSRGTIIRSQSVTGTAPVPSAERLNAGFDEAIHFAAKEFIHDLLGSPS